MKIRISKNRTIFVIFSIILVLFSTTGALMDYILPNNVIRFLLFFVLFTIFLFYGFSSTRKVNSWNFLFLVLMGLTFFNRNYYVETEVWFIVLLYPACLLLCLLSEKHGEWIHSYLKIAVAVYMIHAVCTVVFYFMPSLYLNHIVHLFPDMERRLIAWYNDGCMAGLTNHYSTNGMFLATGLIISISLLLKNHKKKICQYGMTLFILIALFLTGKRGHIVFALAAAFAGYYFYTIDNKRTRLFKIVGILLGFSCLAVLLFILFPAASNFIVRFQESIDAGNISNNRFMFWGLAWKLFQENIFLGIGWGQFQVQSTNILLYTAHVHNTYIQLLCETGLIGALIYYGWMISHIVSTIKNFIEIRRSDLKENDTINSQMMFSLCFQVFFLMYCLTGNPLYEREMFVPYFCACAINIYYRKAIKKKLFGEKQKSMKIGEMDEEG